MIFCVDDDSTIREIEVYTLQQTGFAAKGFADGTELYEALKTEIPELIILDIMLPEKDGMQMLKELRTDSKTKNIPIIMATAKGAEIDKITGLDLGADDYLVKPFGIMEMVSRVKAVLRRYREKKEDGIWRLGNIILNEKSHYVKVGEEEIVLTLKEFELLRLFIKHPGVVFSRDKLLSLVWDVEYAGETRTVDMHIKTLRKKLGSEGKRIGTVIGVGYRLEGRR